MSETSELTRLDVAQAVYAALDTLPIKRHSPEHREQVVQGLAMALATIYRAMAGMEFDQVKIHDLMERIGGVCEAHRRGELQ